MNTKLADFGIPLAIGIAYWLAVSAMLGVREPWDADRYWTLAYPLALLLCAVLGFLRPRRAMLGGVLLILAQLPVLLRGGEVGPLFAVGLLFLAGLSIPAALVAWLAARFARGRA